MPRRAVEEEKGVGNRRGREDYEELDWLFVEADRFLEDEDLLGASEALERAGVKAGSIWVDRPMLTGHTRRLVGLIWEVQEDLNRPDVYPLDASRKDLHELRSWFEIEARRDAARTKADERTP